MKLGSQPQGHQTLAGGMRWMIAMRKRKRAERHEHIKCNSYKLETNTASHRYITR